MSSDLGRRLHIVWSSQLDPAHPTAMTLAMGPRVERLMPVESTDDMDEVLAVLGVLLHGGEATNPRIERDWGPQLREGHARMVGAARPTGPLGRRLGS